MSSGEFPDVAAQDLKNPFMEGYLNKRRPSKTLLSIKYQKRWCVIHNSTFYYYDSCTDRKQKQKGAFSLEGYTFFEKENALTFDLKCYGKRTFEFIASNLEDFRKWKKAVQQASVFKRGPVSSRPERQLARSPPELDDSEGTSGNVWRNQSQQDHSKRTNDDIPYQRSPNMSNVESKRRHETRGYMPLPNQGQIQRESVGEDGYITVLRGQKIPDAPTRFTPTRDAALTQKSDLSNEKDRENVNNLYATVKKEQSNQNDDLYLDLIGGVESLNSENIDDTQLNTDELRESVNEAIYENTSTTNAKTSLLLPSRTNASVQEEDTDSEESSDSSSESDLQDYVNVNVM